MDSRTLIYAYSYTHKANVIAVHGIDADGRTAQVQVHGFMSSVYVNLQCPSLEQLGSPPGSSDLAALIIRTLLQRRLQATWVQRKRLRGNTFSPQTGEERTDTFLKVSSVSWRSLVALHSIFTNGTLIPGVQVIGRVHGLNARPVMQFLTAHQLHSAGWIAVDGARKIGAEDVDCDYYIKCWASNGSLVAVDAEQIIAMGISPLPPARVLSFDIEAFSSESTRMPTASCPEDKVFQIGVCSTTLGDTAAPRQWLLTLGAVYQPFLDEGTCVIQCDHEGSLISEFARLVQQIRPHIVTGYNIFGFDFPFLADRAKLCRVFPELLAIGWGAESGELKTVSWSSSARPNQKFTYIEAPGRVMIDMYAVASADFKLDNYRLATVAAHVLGAHVGKDPLEPAGIFAAYRLGVLGQKPVGASANPLLGQKALAACGKYCVKDARLTLDIFVALDTFANVVEMASTMHVHVESVYTQGQQAKVFSLLYKLCVQQQRVFESRIQAEGDETAGFAGAYVFDPVPGVYADVVPFDFSSLYPSVIIRYNICLSTLADNTFPDTLCHVVEFDDHIGCEHDKHKRPSGTTRVCSTRRYKFRRSPQGVLPRLLEDLLAARKNTRAILRSAEPGSAMAVVLDKRQLAYKVAANSVYGALGVKSGMLSFLEGASSVTALGRQNIKRAAAWMQAKVGAELVYGDTDSVYLHFPQFADTASATTDDERAESAARLWDHCMDVEKRINAELFEAPMKLVFEEAIYSKFLIFSKKRYVCRKLSRDGVESDRLAVRGVLLTRRDNSKVMRRIYESLVRHTLAHSDMDRAQLARELRSMIVSFLQDEIFGRRAPFDDFVVTKSVNEISGYKVRPLPDEPAKLAKRLHDLGCTEDDYAEHALPANAQLAERMRRRGQPVAAGSRVEFVFVDTPGTTPSSRVAKRIEHADYARARQAVLALDYCHYVKLMESPIDELLTVVAGAPSTFAKRMFKDRVHKWQYLAELRRRAQPAVVVV